MLLAAAPSCTVRNFKLLLSCEAFMAQVGTLLLSLKPPFVLVLTSGVVVISNQQPSAVAKPYVGFFVCYSMPQRSAQTCSP
jgi:hypothetical protein